MPSSKAFLCGGTVIGSKEDYSVSKLWIPSRFVDSNQTRTGRARRALQQGGPGTRLFEELSYPFAPYLYSLHHHHLGLDATFARSELIYDHAAIEVWLGVIRQHIEPPYMYKFEVGKGSFLTKLGDLHVHLIADEDAGLPHISRSGEIIKPIREGTAEKLLRYMYKIPVPLKGFALIEYHTGLIRASKKGKKLPPVSGFVWE
jgi:hypothetical protein